MSKAVYSTQSETQYDVELGAEREQIAFLYGRLDAERAAASGELKGVLRDGSAETTEDLWQRDVAAGTLSSRIGRLRVADNGLCFGRLDQESTARRSYIGRIGLFDEDDDYEPLLTDWRAPVARPFYVATAANPEGVTRRRHFRTRGRRVLDFHDDVLDHGVADSDEVLLAALNAPRGETMGDIVATIQAEQDEIIRLGHTGVVVIDGGPGTGKTVVALHRVAYLLYAHRERMSRRGVLIIGPNTGLPALHRRRAALARRDRRGVRHARRAARRPGDDRDRPARTRAGQGRPARWSTCCAAAVADRQELPGTPIEIELDDVTVEIDDEIAARARARARATGRLHNQAPADLPRRADPRPGRAGRGPHRRRLAGRRGTMPELADDMRADVRRGAVPQPRAVGRGEQAVAAARRRTALLVELYGSPSGWPPRATACSRRPTATRCTARPVGVDGVRRAAARRGRSS